MPRNVSTVAISVIAVDATTVTPIAKPSDTSNGKCCTIPTAAGTNSNERC